MRYSYNFPAEMRDDNQKAPRTSIIHNTEGSLSSLVAAMLTQGCVMCCNFKESLRSKDNAFGCSMMGFDYDGNATIEEAKVLFDGYSHFAMASLNHQKDKGDGKGVIDRFHVFVLLDEEINDAELYSFIWSSLNYSFKSIADFRAKDISRLWAKHKSLLWVSKGEKISVSYFKNSYEVLKKKRELQERLALEREAKFRRFNDVDGYSAAHKMMQSYRPAISGSGGHDATFAVACMCRKCGLSEIEIYSILKEYNNKCVPRWTDNELRHKAKSAFNKVGCDRYSPNYLRKVLSNG